MVRLEKISAGASLPAPWRTFHKGSGRLELTGQTLRLSISPLASGAYTNAQIDDYQTLLRRDFLWRPPLQMTVRARFSHPAGQLLGTAGFGFWNDPFMMTGKRRPALPRAIWFFYSSAPSNMKLDFETPGPGWKAATVDAIRWPFFLLAPTAPLAVPLMNIGWLYRSLWPTAQRAIGVREKLLPVEMTDWHTYVIDWQPGSAAFMIDDQPVLLADTSPSGPLGFVMWLDNQYMVVTPWGKFSYGVREVPQQQWLEISSLAIEAGVN